MISPVLLGPFSLLFGLSHVAFESVIGLKFSSVGICTGHEAISLGVLDPPPSIELSVVIASRNILKGLFGID